MEKFDKMKKPSQKRQLAASVVTNLVSHQWSLRHHKGMVSKYEILAIYDKGPFQLRSSLCLVGLITCKK